MRRIRDAERTRLALSVKSRDGSPAMVAKLHSNRPTPIQDSPAHLNTTLDTKTSDEGITIEVSHKATQRNMSTLYLGAPKDC